MMKKLLFVLIMLSTLIIAGALYGTSSFNVGDETALSLEHALMAQYPKTMPDVLFDPMPTHIPF